MSKLHHRHQQQQTHFQLNCIPHSSLSDDAYITVDLRSLYCSRPSSSLSDRVLLEEGAIFRIEATVTGMGVPCHDTPIASVYSTPLAPVSTRRHPCHPDGPSPLVHEPSKECSGNVKSLEPVLTATHSCRWSTAVSNRTPSTTTSTSTGAGTAAAAAASPLNRLVFPILYKHVQRDACLLIRLWAFCPKMAEMKMIRQASFPLWDDKGRFPTGLQRIHLHSCDDGSPNVKEVKDKSVHVPHDKSIWNRNGMCQCKDEKWDAIQILEQLYVMEHEEWDGQDGRDGGDDCNDDHDGKGPHELSKALLIQDATAITSTNSSITSTTTTTTSSSVTSLGMTGRSKSRVGGGGSGDVESSRRTRTRASNSLVKRNVTTTPALEPVPWLDNFAKEWCWNVLSDNEEKHNHLFNTSLSDDAMEQGEDGQYPSDLYYLDDYYLYMCDDHGDQHEDTTVHLLVEFPDCKVPIVHQEVLYAGGMHGASGSVTALDLALFHHEQQVFKHDMNVKEKRLVRDEHGDGTGNGGHGGLVLMPEPMHVNLREDSSHAMNYRMVQFLDMECADDNPVEDKYRTLQHELIRGLVDPALKPDASERNRLNAIINSTSQHLTRQEKDLLWKFRFSLVDNKRALTKFLLAVEWTVESEVVQAAELLEQWRKRSPIEVSDALKLLGKNVAFQTGLVRSYAIDTLASAPDAELELYLLQLVQALKYEQPAMSEGESRTFGNTSIPRETKALEGSSSSSLGFFLIERASKSIELANYLYWYLRVEQEDATHGERYREVFNAMKEKLSKIQYDSKSVTEKRSMWDILSAQDAFVSGILECQKASFHVRGKKDAKEQYLRDALNSPSCKSIRNGWDVPLPSAPHIWVKGVKAESAKMFKSAMYPALLEFYVENKTANASTYKVIVKTGDDLRQDQLVIMLIKLLDRILKRGALDLCLRPYPILAMSAVDQTGLVEFVEGSIPVSQILANHNNSIISFFKSVAPNDSAKYGVDPTVLQTYIRSCAGYCVITYLIGVGDRHL